MNSLSVIIIIIIILLVIYLVLRFYQNKKILESFSTQGSLSTYFQQTVDSDDYMIQPKINSNIIYNSKWNGVWSNEDNFLYALFIEQNDKLIIVLSDFSFNDIYSNAQYNSLTDKGKLFVGIGLLNSNKTIFKLQTVINNGYVNSMLGLGNSSIQQPSFSGNINNSGTTITLYSSQGSGTIVLSLLLNYASLTNPFLNKYIESITPFMTSYPIAIPDSEYIFEENSTCPSDAVPCKYTGGGIATVLYNDTDNNACCNPTSSALNCYMPSIANSALRPKCPPTSNPTVYNFINYAATANLQSVDDSHSNLNICSILNNFNNPPYNYNSAILCYVTNLGNVQTLNYQFFGSLQEQSTLTIQYDFMNSVLNSPITNITTGTTHNLPYYRNIIKNYNSASSNMTDINKAISMTNCMENNNTAGSTNSLITNCVTSCQNYVNSYVQSNSNGQLTPAVWQINYDSSSISGMNNINNLTNDCPFTLSTSSLYNTPVKYVEYNNNGTTSLSLYAGGNQQKLFMENANIIKVPDNNSIIITTNLRANNGLYLLPSSSYGGFSNNSNIVTLASSPNPNGKWFIIGFTLSNINNLSNILNNTFNQITF